jgi:predicted DNA-binding transcriptional regulator AlpA
VSDPSPAKGTTVDQLLKPSDLVRYLGTSRSWIYDAAKRGDIPSIRLGNPDGPLRFVEADIEAWLNDARARWQPGRPTTVTRPSPTARRRTRAKRVAANDQASQMKLEV